MLICIGDYVSASLKLKIKYVYSIVGCFLYLQYNIQGKFCQVFCANSVYSGAFAGMLFSLFSAVQILTVLCRTENRKAKPRNRLGLVSANSIL